MSACCIEFNCVKYVLYFIRKMHTAMLANIANIKCLNVTIILLAFGTHGHVCASRRKPNEICRNWCGRCSYWETGDEFAYFANWARARLKGKYRRRATCLYGIPHHRDSGDRAASLRTNISLRSPRAYFSLQSFRIPSRIRRQGPQRRCQVI